MGIAGLRSLNPPPIANHQFSNHQWIINFKSQIINACFLSMYIELHTSSAFSFLDGASLPATLIERAAELDYPALALLDRDGLYGAPQFYRAAKAAGLKAIVGAELTIGDPGPGAEPTRGQSHFVAGTDPARPQPQA